MLRDSRPEGRPGSWGGMISRMKKTGQCGSDFGPERCVRQKSWRRNPAAPPALGILVTQQTPKKTTEENHGSKGLNGSARTANQVRNELRNVSRETQDFRFFRLFRGGIPACSTQGGTTEDTECGGFEVTGGCCSSVSSVRSVVFTNFRDARTRAISTTRFSCMRPPNA